MPVPDADITRALVVAAHPDDIDFGCAATVASWIAAGTTVTYLLVTRGEQGGFDDTPREAMPALREAEQRAAAAAVDVADVRFLDGYRDGHVEPTPNLVRDISRVIRDVRPQRMLIPSPERNYDRLPSSHPDHMATGEACVRAIYPAARNPFAFPELIEEEGLADWVVSEVFMMAHPGGDHAVDVTEFFDTKISALRQHVSQTAHRADTLADMVREWMAGAAEKAGLPEGRLAETYKVMHLS
ncbi:PIG-L deacetylase family protein [Euzebya tangerina]|uniref:PIG-L deacetylase family protein n=1 Tax=Euzebya tangerina TaxID=591198 RepID=UPI000E30E32D|nr:PIG-L deacetylase family protein [Euzebya tangerina]